MARPPSSAARPLLQEEEDDAPADPGWDAAWDAELDRRIADVREGRVQLIPAEQVFAELDEKLKARRAARLAAKP
jgi:putative addiction module component (TIGR02574 family)